MVQREVIDCAPIDHKIAIDHNWGKCARNGKARQQGPRQKTPREDRLLCGGEIGSDAKIGNPRVFDTNGCACGVHDCLLGGAPHAFTGNEEHHRQWIDVARRIVQIDLPSGIDVVLASEVRRAMHRSMQIVAPQR